MESRSRGGVIGALGNPASSPIAGPAWQLPLNTDRRDASLRPASLLLELIRAYFLHPEQEAQQSAEGQHAALAAFAASANPSRVTANSRTTPILFMSLLLVR